MFGFIAIKAARALATLLICVTAVFVVLRLAGDPADMLLPDDTPAEIKAEYGDVPWSGVGAPIFGRVRSGLRSPRRAT
jgi:peptide/nickel transport system permease protein